MVVLWQQRTSLATRGCSLSSALPTQVPLTSNPPKRKKDESTTTLQLPAKVIKVEKDDNEWSTSVVPQEPNCLPQPQTSFSAPTMAASREGCLLNIMPDSSDEMHDSGKRCSCRHQVDSGGQFAASPRSSQDDGHISMHLLVQMVAPHYLFAPRAPQLS